MGIAGLGIMDFDDRSQRLPGRQLHHPGEEFFLTRGVVLVMVLGIGEAQLLFHTSGSSLLRTRDSLMAGDLFASHSPMLLGLHEQREQQQSTCSRRCRILATLTYIGVFVKARSERSRSRKATGPLPVGNAGLPGTRLQWMEISVTCVEQSVFHPACISRSPPD